MKFFFNAVFFVFIVCVISCDGEYGSFDQKCYPDGTCEKGLICDVSTNDCVGFGDEVIVPENCGNGVIEEGEYCDAMKVRMSDCRDVSSYYVSGVASCTFDCRWDLGDCVRYEAECGNGILEAGEQCEPELNSSTSCVSISFKYLEGDATCTDDCYFDTSDCVLAETDCGNGVVEGGEQCDEGENNGSETCSQDCISLQNNKPSQFEPADNTGNGLGSPDAFMNNWVCSAPGIRNGWRTRAVADVSYDIYICTSSGVASASLTDVRNMMTTMATAFAAGNIRLVERNNRVFTWGNCQVDYDNGNELNQYRQFINNLITNQNQNVLSIVVLDEILPLNVQGFSHPGWPITIDTLTPFVVAHETGHKFALSHTHDCLGGTLETVSNCTTFGDEICDTPPDPGPNWLQNGTCGGACSCNGRCNGVGVCSQGSTPDCSNIMSYYHCWGNFSAEQLDFMRCNLENEMRNFRSNCIPQAEVCNGLDDDCDGIIDENLKRACGSDVGECTKGTQTCSAGKWNTCVGNKGGTSEVCDGKDNDCDGQTDEGLVRDCGTDEGECKKGREYCKNGKWGPECVGGIKPKSEICDNKDNDCDGDIDEDIKSLEQPIVGRCPSKGICMGKAVDICSDGKWKCDFPTGYVKEECPIVNTHCGSGSPSDDLCHDGKDNDCDGVIDENNIFFKCEDLEDYWKIEQGGVCFHGVYGKCQESGGTYECVQLAEDCGVQIDCVGGNHIEDEQCDSQDWNCNGYLNDRNDVDKDGYGDCPGAYFDCSPNDPAINPGASEICDGKDNDCDNSIDEGTLCNDGNPCTVDTCSSGSCKYSPYSCNSHGVCDGDGTCSCDSYWGGTYCTQCTNSKACDDGNLCTVDSCVSGSCKYATINCANGSCKGDGTCNCNKGYVWNGSACIPAYIRLTHTTSGYDDTFYPLSGNGCVKTEPQDAANKIEVFLDVGQYVTVRDDNCGESIELQCCFKGTGKKYTYYLANLNMGYSDAYVSCSNEEDDGNRMDNVNSIYWSKSACYWAP